MSFQKRKDNNLSQFINTTSYFQVQIQHGFSGEEWGTKKGKATEFLDNTNHNKIIVIIIIIMKLVRPFCIKCQIYSICIIYNSPKYSQKGIKCTDRVSVTKIIAT